MHGDEALAKEQVKAKVIGTKNIVIAATIEILDWFRNVSTPMIH